MSAEPPLSNLLLSATGSADWRERETLQQLWSGYGAIVRYERIDAPEGISNRTIIVKQVQPPSGDTHPRGWNTNRSHQRKLRSYQVESEWYASWSALCNGTSSNGTASSTNDCDGLCRIPRCLGMHRDGEQVWILLEDLDAAGFSGRRHQVVEPQIKACINWLANFHARFLGAEPTGLWPVGCYWHLHTRPDEWDELEEGTLKARAHDIDAALSNAQYQTIVHGDAKLANFCFPTQGGTPKPNPVAVAVVAAVDFQYVGGGCGMKDLAYFLGSCLPESECETRESEILALYFDAFRQALSRQKSEMSVEDINAVEAEWRALYPVAWTDFHRFLKGWSPGHWKLTDYSERVAHRVLDQLPKPQA